MHLYTFIIEFLGGTYISQVMALDEKHAMRSWLQNLNVIDIQGLTLNDKTEALTDNFSDEDPILIDGLLNVWHFNLRTQKGIAFINFVKTK